MEKREVAVAPKKSPRPRPGPGPAYAGLALLLSRQRDFCAPSSLRTLNYLALFAITAGPSRRTCDGWDGWYGVFLEASTLSRAFPAQTLGLKMETVEWSAVQRGEWWSWVLRDGVGDVLRRRIRACRCICIGEAPTTWSTQLPWLGAGHWRGKKTNSECGEVSSTDFSSRINKTPKLPPIATSSTLRIPSLNLNLVSSMAGPDPRLTVHIPLFLSSFQFHVSGRKGYVTAYKKHVMLNSCPISFSQTRSLLS